MSSVSTSLDDSKLEATAVDIEESCLEPFSVIQNNRYDRKLQCKMLSLIVSPGLHSNLALQKPQYLPPDWVMHVNPEGAKYYVNAFINVVTDTAIHSAHLYDCVLRGIRECNDLAKQAQITLPQQSELFIQVPDGETVSEKNCSCNYYLVDHDTQTEFWLHSIEPRDMGIVHVSSESQLKYAFQEHYWIHVEYFPHRPIPMKLREELISILRHGALDVITSSTSTFPYDAEQCEKFIKLLADSLHEVSDTYTTCMTARIWSTIARHRYDNCYGEEHARLERDHYIFGQHTITPSIGITIVWTLLLGMPARINKELDALFVDDTVYGIHWRKYARVMTKSWKESRLAAIVLLIVNAILLVNPRGPLSTYVGLASLVCSTTSFIGSLALLQRYTGAEEYVAQRGMVTMAQIQHSKLRFKPAAAVASIPRALAAWSIIFFAVEIVSLALEFCTSWATFVMVALFALVFSAFIVRFIILQSMTVWRRRRTAQPKGHNIV